MGMTLCDHVDQGAMHFKIGFNHLQICIVTKLCGDQLSHFFHHIHIRQFFYTSLSRFIWSYGTL